MCTAAESVCRLLRAGCSGSSLVEDGLEPVVVVAPVLEQGPQGLEPERHVPGCPGAGLFVVDVLVGGYPAAAAASPVAVTITVTITVTATVSVADTVTGTQSTDVAGAVTVAPVAAAEAPRAPVPDAAAAAAAVVALPPPGPRQELGEEQHALVVGGVDGAAPLRRRPPRPPGPAPALRGLLTVAVLGGLVVAVLRGPARRVQLPVPRRRVLAGGVLGAGSGLGAQRGPGEVAGAVVAGAAAGVCARVHAPAAAAPAPPRPASPPLWRPARRRLLPRRPRLIPPHFTSAVRAGVVGVPDPQPA